MSLSIHEVSVPVLRHGLGSLSRLLGKVENEAAARGIGEAGLLAARLAPDMFPFVQQVQTVSDMAKGAAARLAGEAVPVYPDVETSLAELRRRIDRTAAYLAQLDPAKFDGAEGREIALVIGGKPVAFSGRDYLFGLAFPNFYFHLATAYGIARHLGFDIGKLDYLGRKP